jgi:sRNA-binding protein
MSMATGSSWHSQTTFAAVVLVVFLFAAEGLAAGQDPQRKFKPGEMVYADGGQSLEIIRCEGEGFEEECEVLFYRDGQPSGRPTRFSGRNIRAGEERLKGDKEREAAKERAKARQQTGNTNDNATEGPTAGQDPQRKFKPGEIVYADGGQSLEIIRCEGEGFEEECEVLFYRDGQPSGRPTRFSGRNIRAGEERLKAEKEREAAKERAKARQQTTNAGDNPADNKTTTTQPRESTKPAPVQPKPQPQTGPVAGVDGKWKVGDKLEVNQRAFWYPAKIIEVKGGKYKIRYDAYDEEEWVDDSRMRPIGGHQIAAACEYDLPGDVSRTARPSEQLFKKKIWQRYSFASKKGGSPSVSAADDIGIAFVSFQMRNAFTNTVSVVPGTGATRRNNGAPPNATIYPIKTKFVICEKYGEKLDRYLHDDEMHCFKDKHGEWLCDGAGVPKRTPID